MPDRRHARAGEFPDQDSTYSVPGPRIQRPTHGYGTTKDKRDELLVSIEVLEMRPLTSRWREDYVVDEAESWMRGLVEFKFWRADTVSQPLEVWSLRNQIDTVPSAIREKVVDVSAHLHTEGYYNSALEVMGELPESPYYNLYYLRTTMQKVSLLDWHGVPITFLHEPLEQIQLRIDSTAEEMLARGDTIPGPEGFTDEERLQLKIRMAELEPLIERESRAFGISCRVASNPTYGERIILTIAGESSGHGRPERRLSSAITREGFAVPVEMLYTL